MELARNNPPNINGQNPSLSSVQPSINKVIGVTSAKGGAGRSFISGLLAVELNKKGYVVGILDANFTGSSIPSLFGQKGPVSMGRSSFLPLETDLGIKLLSANLLVDEENNMIIWKEALAGKVIEELYREVEWGTLDYLIVDLPPTASEITVSILQTIPFDAMVFVNQPQGLSARLNARGIRIVKEMGLDIAGIVENMSYHFDHATGKKAPIFGTESTGTLAASVQLPVLGCIPYLAENALLCDQGKMEAVSLPEGEAFCETFEAALFDLEERALQRAIEAQAKPEPEPVAEPKPVDQGEPEISGVPEEIAPADQYFSDTVIHLIRSQYNVGTLDKPDAQGHFLGSCGDRMQIDLKIVKQRIMDAKFIADGCGATLACGSMITRMATTKTLEEAQRIQADELINALDGLPDDHLHCAELAVMTLREAVIDAIEGHRNRQR